MAEKFLAIFLLLVALTSGRRLHRDVSELRGYFYEKPAKPFTLPTPIEIHEAPAQELEVPIIHGVPQEPSISAEAEVPGEITHLPQEIAPPEEPIPQEVVPEEPVEHQETVPHDHPSTPEVASEKPASPPEVIVPEEPSAELKTTITPEEPTVGDTIHSEEERPSPPQEIIPPEEPTHPEEPSVHPDAPMAAPKEIPASPSEEITLHPEEYLPPKEETRQELVAPPQDEFPQQPEIPGDNSILQPEEYLPPEGTDVRPISEYGVPITKPCNVKSGRINCLSIKEPEIILEPAENTEYLPPHSI